MDQIYAKYACDGGIIGVGTGATMKEFSKYLEPNNSYAATSIQTEIFLTGLPMVSCVSCQHLDVYFDSADYYSPRGCLIKGGGGALTNEKLFMSMADLSVILVQKSKRVRSFEGRLVPVEIIKSSYGYVRKELKKRGIRYKLRTVHSKTPFLTDLGNLIIDVEYNRDFLDNCVNLTGVVEHGFFPGGDKVVIEEL
ncbi:ribose 5-phosphate isomerase A [Pancytospora philotis]|nr:ribose 5-phosphate isomerase A [Pancytospora philotis]